MGLGEKAAALALAERAIAVKPTEKDALTDPMHPVVQATTRTPGPSTVDPVVYECRNPMVASNKPSRRASGTSAGW